MLYPETEYSSESVSTPLDLVAKAMAATVAELMTLRAGDCLVIMCEQNGITVATQRTMFPESRDTVSDAIEHQLSAALDKAFGERDNG